MRMRAGKMKKPERRMAGSVVLIALALLLLSACSYEGGSVNASQEPVLIRVSLNDITYMGSYEGEMDGDGQPNGTGTFVTADTENTSFTLEGTWSDGELYGKAEVCYADGSVLAVTFSEGVATGKATMTAADGTSRVFRFANGVATGRVRVYSQDGVMTGFDYYYDGDLVSELCDQALSLDYGEILSNPLEYIYEPLKISGSVVGVYEAEKEELLVIEDSGGQLYLCNYKNNGYNAPQALMPNLEAGDSVVLYGFLSDCIVADYSSWTDGVRASSVSEELDYTGICDMLSQLSPGGESTLVYGQMSSTMPYLYLFYGEVKGETFDLSVLDEETAVSYDYDLLCRYPYYFVNFEYTGTGTVQELILDYDSMEATMVLQLGEEGSQIFYASYTWSSDDTLPVVGETITVTGLLKGNAKIAVEIAGGEDGSVNYLICPKLSVTEIEVSS
ncbi:MAG: hypothetical protein LUF30_05500 [Lachnospiraceae bacterium]|nr:hypothetical protein [Lachnospiraceae bacterium]